MKRVILLSTGAELMHGAVVDTNSGFISGRLFPYDVRVTMHLVTGDEPAELEQALRYSLDNSDIVIMTGGLGPTDDDNTIEAVMRIFGCKSHIDATARSRMEALFKNSGMPMSSKDLKMAEVPDGSAVLDNSNGLAPGFVMRRSGKFLIAMPGVPREMAQMTDRSVIPFLERECGIMARKNAYFRVVAMKESDINAAVREMGLDLERMEWGITAKDGIMTVTFVEKDLPVDLSAIIPEAVRHFGARFLDPSYSSPEEDVVRMLANKKLTVSFAESCTGGLLSKKITDIPGSSAVFIGSVVAYDNSVKTGLLHVSPDILEEYGAVSSQTAEQMASGVKNALSTDIGVSTTGIAGPGGGTAEKPAGTVWFALADAHGVTSFKRFINGDRERVRAFASLIAIENLREYLKGL
jgi:nicotinamide-nucleotide amidase